MPIRHKTPPIETSRLVLQPLEHADAPAIQRIFPRREIVEYLSSAPWPYPDDGALTFIRDLALPAMHAGKEWHWSIRPKQEPTRLIGSIALYDRPENNRGFWLDPAWQRQGLMHEAADAVTDFWFEGLDRHLLRVPKAIRNERSRRISIRSGMRVVAVFEKDYVGGRMPTELWEITRDEWRRRDVEPR